MMQEFFPTWLTPSPHPHSGKFWPDFTIVFLAFSLAVSIWLHIRNKEVGMFGKIPTLSHLVFLKDCVSIHTISWYEMS